MKHVVDKAEAIRAEAVFLNIPKYILTNFIQKQVFSGILCLIQKLKFSIHKSYNFGCDFLHMNKTQFKFKGQKQLFIMDLQSNFISPTKKTSSIETPVKKTKLQLSCDAKTAESPNPSKLSISDIDAEELFDDFNKMVIVSEYDEEYDASEPYRKLDFGEEIKNKLDFDQKTASMVKKRKPIALEENLSIKPFKITESEKPDEAESSSPCTPALRIKTKIGMMTTPPKKVTKSAQLQKAAKKQDPFRELKKEKQDK